MDEEQVPWSLLSATLATPELDDMTGLLAAHGQGSTTGRLSIVVDDEWRAAALVAELEDGGLPAVRHGSLAAGDDRAPGLFDDIPTPAGAPRLLVRVEDPRVGVLVGEWTQGAVKHVPDAWVPSPRALRLWLIAAGRPCPRGWILASMPAWSIMRRNAPCSSHVSSGRGSPRRS